MGEWLGCWCGLCSRVKCAPKPSVKALLWLWILQSCVPSLEGLASHPVILLLDVRATNFLFTPAPCFSCLSWAGAQGSLPTSWGLPVCSELSIAVPAPIQSPHVTDLGNVTGEGGCRASLCLSGFSLPKAKVHSVCSCWYKIIAFAFLIAVGKG